MSNEAVVKANIHAIYARRKLATIALCKYYATLVIKDFRAEQTAEKYWVNRTFFARDLMFSKQFIEADAVGFFLSHGVEYGVYLETANNGQNAALEPTVNKFLPQFRKDMKSLW